MATKRKSSPGSTRAVATASAKEKKKRPDPKTVRSDDWSAEWASLCERYGGPRKFAEEVLGISYQSLWRYAVRGDDVPAIVGNFVRVLAATQGLKSPV